jgi:hypothetical protein
LYQFGFQEFQADADRAEFVALKKLRVLIGQDIGRRRSVGARL